MGEPSDALVMDGCKNNKSFLDISDSGSGRVSPGGAEGRSPSPSLEINDGNTVWKHSSGDLHSRLKTRKIMGMGETDNGDIHRSKISQVLGHNEHLYVKLPKGFWTWHMSVGAAVTLEAAILLLMPTAASLLGLYPQLPSAEASTAHTRMAGAALAGLGVFVWSVLGTSDKHFARSMLLAVFTYHLLAASITGLTAIMQDAGEEVNKGRVAVMCGLRVIVGLLCLAYFHKIAAFQPIRGQRSAFIRNANHGSKID